MPRKSKAKKRSGSHDLVRTLRRLVTHLERDLAAQLKKEPTRLAELKASWETLRERERTGASFAKWRAEYLTQVAVAWVLATVFVRYLEDNGLLDTYFISGHGEAWHEAEATYEAYFRGNPTASDTDYLLHVFRSLARQPAGEVFSESRNLLYRLRISGDAAKAMRDQFRQVDSAGAPALDYRAVGGDTRLLGDLYEELSKSARDRYALHQTPVFVEEFILGHTLAPAIETFGLDGVRVIDPACGSGHFLLGAFNHLVEHKLEKQPALDRKTLVTDVLRRVCGVDINPFAVAIARFRLTVAALSQLRPGGVVPFSQAPRLSLRVAAGDSLLLGQLHQQLDLDLDANGDLSALHGAAAASDSMDDSDLATSLLSESYEVVVGNPPYITPSDQGVNRAYRKHYRSCYRQYSLVCPFFERFFDLAVTPQNPNPESSQDSQARHEVKAQTSRTRAGYVGLILSNAFMKRQYGVRLVEEIVPKTDLTHLIDTSGAYIPGHGTPTVILFGRARTPSMKSKVTAVLGIRGEPETPASPEKAQVWRAIVENTDNIGFENDFISVDKLGRGLLDRHPWTIRGGGAIDAKVKIEGVEGKRLELLATDTGRTTHTGLDDAFFHTRSVLRRHGASRWSVPLVTGQDVRDWTISEGLASLFPYDPSSGVRLDSLPTELIEFCWRLRTPMALRRDFKKSLAERGLEWWEHSMFFARRYKQRLSITFACVATHNHFVLDRGGKVFNRHAPVLKLKKKDTEDTHLGLLGLLNSSTACFWMKMVFFTRGGPGGRKISSNEFQNFYEHDATKLIQFPVTTNENRPVDLARRLDRLGAQLVLHMPRAVAESGVPTPERLDEAVLEAEAVRRQMIALQEELDWTCYRLYGLLDQEAPVANDKDRLPKVALGERAFEIVLARKMKSGKTKTEWFREHRSEPVTEIPERWPNWYRHLVQRRIALIEKRRFVRLIEQPEFKRRWQSEPWPDREARALRRWLLDRLESARYIPEAGDSAMQGGTKLTSLSQLADEARRDPDLQTVAARYTGNPTFDVDALVGELVLSESVPALPRDRYSASGLEKRREWEAVWEMQRQEDAIDSRVELPRTDPNWLNEAGAQLAKERDIGDIPRPPDYRTGDFRSKEIWSLRGKLDVPKERFRHYTGADEARDGGAVLAWAGLDHRQQAEALAGRYFMLRDQRGWSTEQLLPLLAAMTDLMPWLKQWHNEVDPASGQGFADAWAALLDAERRRHGLSAGDVERQRIGE